jgi:pimeloyl-ACP methyl ester carboxylesterase
VSFYPVRAPRIALALVCAVALTSFLAVASAHAATPAKQAKPTVVLVHGAWADGSSWAGVTRVLQHRGYTVDVPPNPLRGVQADAAYLKDYLTTIDGPIVLAGHSYGGAVTTNAATGNAHVKALVYADAFIPDQGESLLTLLTPRDPSQPAIDPNALFNSVPFPGAPKGVADLYLKPSVFPGALANDLPRRAAKVLAATQRPVASNGLTDQSGVPAWKTIPSWATVGTEDHIIPPALQTFMAKRARAHITNVKGSHLSIITHPTAIANVIVTAAKHTR